MTAMQQERTEAEKILAELAYYEMSNPYKPRSPEEAIPKAKAALRSLIKKKTEKLEFYYLSVEEGEKVVDDLNKMIDEALE